MKERVAVYILAGVLLAAIITVLLLPFILAAYYGAGWLALNYVTVPAFLALQIWGERRKK